MIPTTRRSPFRGLVLATVALALVLGTTSIGASGQPVQAPADGSAGLAQLAATTSRSCSAVTVATLQRYIKNLEAVPSARRTTARRNALADYQARLLRCFAADPTAVLLARGRDVFRYETWGDEAFWTDTIELHKSIEGSTFGGVGAGVSPKTALAVGLKVDVDAVPASVVAALKQGKVNLDDPAVTLTLLKIGAVVGVKASLKADGSIDRLGLTCAVCHSTVDDSFAPGIGHRLDGWANRDLDPGLIISLAANPKPVADELGVDVPTLKSVLTSWGPGRFDAIIDKDGPTKAVNPFTGKPASTLIPPAYGLAGFNLHTWTGWGSVPYWNAYVAATELKGTTLTFYDPRLNDPVKYPIAVKSGSWNTRGSDPANASQKLDALQMYQLSLPAPTPPAGSFDAAAAQRGRALFVGAADCARCHVPPLFSEPGYAIHTGAEIGIDDFQADRSPAGGYRTAPLKGIWAHQKGGFYHDGRFPTLLDVVNHYNTFFKLGLTDAEQRDLVQYLLSL